MIFPRKSYKKFNYVLLGLVVFAALLGSFTRSRHAGAASYTWDGGCGVTTTWSCANNWSSNIVPAAGDTVTFNNTSDNNSTVDALFNATETITTINISSGYDGTITLATTLHVTTSWVQGAGTFTAGAQTLDIDGTFTLTAGSFTASSGTTSVASSMTISGTPTFNHNSGTFTYDGSASNSWSCNNVVFNLVTFAHTAGTKTVSSNCSLPLGSSPTLTGAVVANGTLSGSNTLTGNSSLVLSAANSLSGFTGLITAGAVTLQNAVTFNFGSYTTFDINGTFTLQSSAIFTAPSGTATFASTFTLNSGTTFNANGGTVTFDGTASATLTCNNVTFNLVTFTHISGTKTVSSDCSMPLGANPTMGTSTGSVTLSGTLSGSGTLTMNSTGVNTLTLSGGSAALSGFSGLITSIFTISGTTFNAGSYTTFDINNTFTLSTSAVFTAPSGNANFAVGFTINTGTTFNHSNGTVIFDSGNTGTLSCNNVTFNLVTFAHTAGVKTIGSNCSLPLGANPTIGSGSAGMTLNGTLSGSGTMSINNASGTLRINSTGVLSGFSGLVANALTIDMATLNLGSYTTVDVNSAFILQTGAVFTAPSGTATFASSFTLNSGTTFNANGGLVTFDGTTTATLSCNSASFNLVTFAHTAGGKTVSSDCSLPLGANPTIGSSTGSMVLNGTLSGSGTLTTLSFTLNSTGVLSGFTGLILNGTYAQSGATLNLGSYTTADFNGSFTLSSNAVFTARTGTTTFAAAFTINSGTTFNANGGTVTFDGAVSVTLSCNNTVFNLVTFAHTAGTKTVGSTCSLPLGANPTIGSGTALLALNGTLSGSGTLSVPFGTFALSATYALIGFTSLITNSFTITGAVADFSSYSSINIVDASLTLSSGSVFTAPVLLKIGGSIVLNSGTTFNHNSGTLEFTNSNSNRTLTCNNQTFNLVVFSHTANTKVVNADCNLPLGNNPNVGAGGSLQLIGGLTGTGTLTTTGVFTLNSTATLSGFSGLSVDAIVSAASLDLSAFGTYEVSSDYLQVAGAISLPSGSNINGGFTIMKPAILTAPSGTLSVAGDFNAGTNPGQLYLPGTSGNYASVPDSAPISITGDIDIRVSVALDTWRTGLTQTLVSKYDGTLSSDRSYQLSISSTGSLLFIGSNLGTSTTYSATSTASVNGNDGSPLWLRATRNATSGNVTFYTSTDGYSWSQLGSVISLASGVLFDSVAPLRIGTNDINSASSNLASGKFYRAQIRNNILDDGTGIMFDADFTNHADGTTSFTESSSNAATVSLSGSTAAIYSTGAGTFNHNNGTVVLDGGDQEIQGTTFYGLSKTCTTACTLTMPAGSTETMLGTLTLSGTANQLLSLVSSSPGSYWYIDPQGSRNVSYVSVQDNNNLNNSFITACNSVDAGHTVGWSFNPSSCTTQVSGSTSSTSTSSDSDADEAEVASDVTAESEPTEDNSTVDLTDVVLDKGTSSKVISRLLYAWLIINLLAGLLLLIFRRRFNTDDTTEV